jgi:hypothetical protein
MRRMNVNLRLNAPPAPSTVLRRLQVGQNPTPPQAGRTRDPRTEESQREDEDAGHPGEELPWPQ